MARIHCTDGACPVCDRPVLRTIHTLAGLSHEVYHCPDHGRMDYSADIALADLAASLETRAALSHDIHGVALVQ